MGAKINSYIFKGLLTLMAGVMVVPFMASCGKSGSVTPSTINTQLNVINLSPDIYPIDLYINNLKINTSPYRFPTSSGYFSLNVIGQPLQIRSNTGTQPILYQKLDSIPNAKAKYTLFVTGLRSQNSDTAFLLTDTSTLAAVGRGKLRFVNASLPNTTELDVYANGTKIFSGIPFIKYTSFTELPAGNYDIKIYAKGDVTTILQQINPLTIQDSKLYTLYTYGIAGHTDTAALSSAVIINK